MREGGRKTLAATWTRHSPPITLPREARARFGLVNYGFGGMVFVVITLLPLQFVEVVIAAEVVKEGLFCHFLLMVCPDSASGLL